MMRKRRLLMAAVALCLLVGCNDGKVYDRYRHTPLTGWEKNDTLSFSVGRVKQAGSYNAELGLRINGSYPFTSLTLLVEHEVLPSHEHGIDTLTCVLTDKDGIRTGRGLSTYQYEFRIRQFHLVPNDSIHFEIRHDMKREILPGISDIGIAVRKVGSDVAI